MKKKIAALAIAALGIAGLTACSDDATIVDENLDRAADNFEIPRRIVFINGITDNYILTVEGFCSITDEGKQLEVLCKTGPDSYKKHLLGKSDNTIYDIEQLEPVKTDSYHYRVTFKPEQVVPEFDLRTSN